MRKLKIRGCAGLFQIIGNLRPLGQSIFADFRSLGLCQKNIFSVPSPVFYCATGLGLLTAVSSFPNMARG
jgi:hypothetical protein